MQGGGARAPARAALTRFWVRERLLRIPLLLTGAAALRPEAPIAPEAWVGCFLDALAAEAVEGLQLLLELELSWIAARNAVAGRRRTSRAAAAVDLLAAAPLLSASTLARGLGMAVKNAAALLDEFCRLGITVEVSHRAKRRLFGLAGMAPLRDQTAAPAGAGAGPGTAAAAGRAGGSGPATYSPASRHACHCP